MEQYLMLCQLGYQGRRAARRESLAYPFRQATTKSINETKQYPLEHLSYLLIFSHIDIIHFCCYSSADICLAHPTADALKHFSV